MQSNFIQYVINSWFFIYAAEVLFEICHSLEDIDLCTLQQQLIPNTLENVCITHNLNLNDYYYSNCYKI